jgi:alpha-galactosidase
MTVHARFKDLKLQGKQVARDLWRQKDLGSFQDEFAAPVPPHGVVLITLRGAR